MSAFRSLREASNRFEEDLCRQASTLFSAKPEQTPEHIIQQKLENVSLYSSKFRLLHAKLKAGRCII